MRISSRVWFSAAVAVLLSAASVRALEVGDAAPPIQLDKWVVGEPVDPAKPDGKSVTIVEFWQIPCPPCEEATRKLNALYKEYKDKGLRIVAVNGEEEAVTRERLKKIPNDFPSAIDEKGTVYKPYMDVDDRDQHPFVFVVDKEGKILWMGVPGMGNELDRVVAGALDGSYTMEKAKELAKLREELNGALQLRDPDAVLGLLEKLSQADPKNAEWIVNLYNIASRTGKDDKAAAALKIWRESFTDDAQAQVQLAATLMTLAEMDQRDPVGAMEAARRAARLEPANPMVVLTAAQVLMDIGRLDEAAKLFASWKGDEETSEHVAPIVKQNLAYIEKLKLARDAK